MEYVRLELAMLEEVIKSHETLVDDIEMIPLLEEKQREEVAHLEEKIKYGREMVLVANKSGWSIMSMRIQNMEPHSPQDLQTILFKEGIYKDTIRRLMLKWIGLKFNPPLLLYFLTT